MRFDSLQDWLSWQETLHPEEIELGLERVQSVWQRLCPDPDLPRVITVAGTNGKGSCCAMLESVYHHAGYRTGSYTSPHLLKYNERIHLHCQQIDDESLCQAFEAVDQARAQISLTYFEFATLAALYIFMQAGLDIIILEAGLGGRLDAVNIIDADVALLTSVGLDHQDWLGDDRESIGFEKAGIFRTGKPVICAEIQPPQSVLAHADSVGAHCLRQGEDFRYQLQDKGWSWHGQNQTRSALPMPALRGGIQLQNASAVLAVIEALDEKLPVEQAAVRQGLLDLDLAGRFQLIAGDIPVILDVAHNPAAVEELIHNLNAYHCQGQVHLVLGMLQGKDAAGVVALLAPRVSTWHLVSINHERGQDVTALAKVVESQGCQNVYTYDSIQQGITAAQVNASSGDCVLITGSFYTVATALQYHVA